MSTIKGLLDKWKTNPKIKGQDKSFIMVKNPNRASSKLYQKSIVPEQDAIEYNRAYNALGLNRLA